MSGDGWLYVLVAALVFNAAVGFGYRVYRLSLGGPIADVWGQAVLGVALVLLAVGTALGLTWLRWPALVYGGLFALLVMPIWVLGVLIPLRPRAVDYAFTVTYWIALCAIVVSALAL